MQLPTHAATALWPVDTQGLYDSPAEPPPAWLSRLDVGHAQPVMLDPGLLQENRILLGNTPGPFAESFHLLRTRLLHTFRENGWNSLAVTSPRSGTGKTLTSINLAISMARLIGQSVLLVDTNLRQPGLLAQLGLEEGWGLRDYLTDDMPVNNLLVRSDLFEDLAILPSGEALEDCVGILGSLRMHQLMQELRSRSGNLVVILDLPPILESGDAITLASEADAALLVVEDGVTSQQDVTQAVELLRGTELAGTVLNKAPGIPLVADKRTLRGRLFPRAA